MIEAALLGSGRPVLVAPVDWKPRQVGRKIVTGWDASGEAARAMHDALLLAAEDAEITIVTVDAKPGSLDHGDAPGLDIAAHLARHGLKVELRNEANLGRSTHEVLMQVATDINADLMVLGGYRHSRLQQTLFGGVTRNMLRDVKLPLLLSH
ncbi:MAG: universal stress protein [Hyphomonas sp.]|nr:universal stress protein [Hyphomonas sp.]